MEPHWNPMVEAQAVDRVHRIGQTREVNITRYRVKESIEEVSIPLATQYRPPRSAVANTQLRTVYPLGSGEQAQNHQRILVVYGRRSK